MTMATKTTTTKGSKSGAAKPAKSTAKSAAAKAEDRTYDAIVIGGGHNGLVNGAYLAKAGLKTLIIERRHTVGGAQNVATCARSSSATRRCASNFA